ncbi:MAG: L,D-transpeptidase family protein [Pseudomonadota bacterium]
MTPNDMVLTPMGLRFGGRVFACNMGKSGVTRDKREGDGATPAGDHGIVGCLYRRDRLARPCDWAVAIGPSDLWSDDPGDEDYNLLVRAPYAHSHERLARADRQYDLILVTDWNWPRAVRGRGSAIFIHVWRGPGQPTAGCIALGKHNLLWIVRRLRFGCRLIVPAGLA